MISLSIFFAFLFLPVRVCAWNYVIVINQHGVYVCPSSQEFNTLRSGSLFSFCVQTVYDVFIGMVLILVHFSQSWLLWDLVVDAAARGLLWGHLLEASGAGIPEPGRELGCSLVAKANPQWNRKDREDGALWQPALPLGRGGASCSQYFSGIYFLMLIDSNLGFLFCFKIVVFKRLNFVFQILVF